LYEIVDQLVIASEENYISANELTTRKEQINKCPAIIKWIYKLPKENNHKQVTINR